MMKRLIVIVALALIAGAYWGSSPVKAGAFDGNDHVTPAAYWGS